MHVLGLGCITIIYMIGSPLSLQVTLQQLGSRRGCDTATVSDAAAAQYYYYWYR